MSRSKRIGVAERQSGVGGGTRRRFGTCCSCFAAVEQTVVVKHCIVAQAFRGVALTTGKVPGMAFSAQLTISGWPQVIGIRIARGRRHGFIDYRQREDVYFIRRRSACVCGRRSAGASGRTRIAGVSAALAVELQSRIVLAVFVDARTERNTSPSEQKAVPSDGWRQRFRRGPFLIKTGRPRIPNSGLSHRAQALATRARLTPSRMDWPRSSRHGSEYCQFIGKSCCGSLKSLVSRIVLGTGTPGQTAPEIPPLRFPTDPSSVKIPRGIVRPTWLTTKSLSGEQPSVHPVALLSAASQQTSVDACAPIAGNGTKRSERNWRNT